MKLKHFIMMLDDFVEEDEETNNEMHIEIIDKDGCIQRVKGVDIDTKLGENEEEEEVVKIEFWI